MQDGLKRRLKIGAVIFGIWTAIGLFFFSQSLGQMAVSRDPTPWWHSLTGWLTGVYINALLTPVILWLGSRFPFERRNWLRRAALHLAFSISFAAIQLVVESAILPRLGVFPLLMRTFASTLVFLAMIAFHQNVLTYWTILGIQYGIGYYRRYQEREQQALRL